MRQHKEHLAKDFIDIIQLLVVEHLQGEGSQCGGCADEDVQAREAYEGRTRNVEDVGERVHHGNNRPAEK